MRRAKTSLARGSRGPGVLLFSSAQSLICYDDRAVELCQKLKNGRRSPASKAKPEVPTAFGGYCSELLAMLQAHPDLEDCKDFKIKRILSCGNIKLVINGIGFPNAAGKGRPLVLLLLQEVGDQGGATTYHAKQLFGLSEREASVFQHLLKGLTNKEIAEALNITEQSVKQHFKNIMMKTESSTRTGVILSVLGSQGLELS
jgi:DNA-binding CsgD family transcriptional regulator